MKKLILAVLVGVLLAGTAFSQTWHTANQTTVAWDASPDVMEVGERITYVVYLVNAKSDPDKTNPVEVGRTQATQQLLTLGTKGSYFVGVQSVMEVEETTFIVSILTGYLEASSGWEEVSASVIGWSDDPLYAQGGVTFGLRFYPAPGVITNLRPQ